MPARKLRVILDTNVVVSSFWGGPPQQILNAWFDEQYALLISAPILAEYQTVLERLLPQSEKVARFLHAVYLKAILVAPKLEIRKIQTDPSDNRFLECAQAGRGNFIVSGDRHLLQLERFGKIGILTPRQFLKHL